jgi:hypothetical protein
MLSEARDGGRSLGSHARLHLWVCDVCRRLQAQLALIGAAAARAPEEGPCLTEEAKARLRRALGLG